MISEDIFYAKLLENKKNGELKVKVEDIDIIPNYKLIDSPDIVLILKLKLNFFSRDYDIEIPIPVEVEKAGFHPALEDLRKFVEREHFKLLLPMIIISEKGFRSDEKEYPLKTKFKIKQIPYTVIVQKKVD
jgi:hypothetical protein